MPGREKPGKPPTVAELLERIRGGDREARRELIALLGDEKEFRSRLLSIVRRRLPRGHRGRRHGDSQDVVQSVLADALRHLSAFRGRTENEFYGWLRTIVRTKVNRLLRRREQAAGSTELEKGARNPYREDHAPIEDIVIQESIASLHSAIGRLPLGERLVIELRLRGHNAPEIANLLGLKPATVRQRESRAMRHLERLMGGSTP